MMFQFPKSLRLLRSRHFRLCEKYGKEKQGHFLHVKILIFENPSTSFLKLGLTVSKRFGKATQRNRFKRIVREVFRCSQHDLPKNMHITVRPRFAAHGASFLDIQKELTDLIADIK